MQRKRKFHDNDSFKEKQEDEDKLKRAVKDGDETAVRRLVKGGVLAIRQQKLWVTLLKLLGSIYIYLYLFIYTLSLMVSGPLNASRGIPDLLIKAFKFNINSLS